MKLIGFETYSKWNPDRVETSGIFRRSPRFGCGEVDVSASDKAFIKNPRGGKLPHIVVLDAYHNALQ